MKTRNYFRLCLLAFAMLAFAACEKSDPVDDGGDNKGDNNNPSEVEGGNEWFDVLVYNISTTSVEFDIQPKNPDLYYDYRVVSKADLAAAERTVKMDAENRLHGYMMAIDAGYGSWTGERNPDIFGNPSRGNLKKGPRHDTWDYLLGNEEYILYVYGCQPDYQFGRYVVGINYGRDEDGDRILSGEYEEGERLVYVLDPDVEIATVEFTTKNAAHSDLTFDFVGDYESSGEITVLPSNDDPYYFAIYEADFFEGMSDSEILSYICSKDDVSVAVMHGVGTTFVGPSLEVGRTYVCYMFGFEGGVTTELFKHYFTFEGIDRKHFYTNMTEDENVDFDNATEALITFFGAGDDWDEEKNTNNHFYILLDRYEGNFNAEFFQTEIFAPVGHDTPEGEYKIDLAWSGEPWTALSGELSQLYDCLGTWYVMPSEDQNYMAVLASGDSGTITITKNGDHYTERGDTLGNYTINAEFKGPAGNTIKISYEGEVYYNDVSGTFGKGGSAEKHGKALYQLSTAAKISRATKGRPAMTVAE